jgi:nitrate reductase gamma subunit
MPIHSVLQYSSSIAGLATLALWVLLWYRRTPTAEVGTRPRPKSRFTLAVAIFAVAGLAGLVRALVVVGMPATRSNADVFILVFCVTALALAFWQLLLYCVLVSSHQTWIIT